MEELPIGLLYTFLISTMLAVGLEVTGGEIVAALSSRVLIGRTILANFVIMPVIGVILTKVIPLDHAATAAILLAAAAPGGLRALQFTDKVKDHIYLAAGLMLLLTVLAIIITPFLVHLMLSIDTPYTLPYGRIALFILLLLLLPLALGYLVRLWAAKLANALTKPMLWISNISFIGTIILTFSLNQQSTRAIGTAGVSAMLLLILAGMVVGWFLGGPNKGTRRVMAVNTSMRNVALCLVIAARAFSTADVHVAVIAFAALMVPPNMLFTLYHAFKEKRAEKAIAAG